ncbi:MAG: glycosyltransferase [Suipraeoptans sp.]
MPKNIPKVSVVVPIYNAAKYLNDCIDSIECQTFRDIEIILVNDGSTDSSLAICRKYEMSNNKIKVISQSNKGVSAARNIGKELSVGEYVIFVDADDTLLPTMLQVLMEQILKYDADISICGIQLQDSTKHITQEKENYTSETLTKITAMQLFLNDDKREDDKLELGVWNKLFRRRCINELEFKVGRNMNEDKYFVFEAILNARRIVYRNENLYCYFTRANSQSHKAFDNRWFDNEYFANSIYKRITIEMPELETQARHQLIRTRYFLIKRMKLQNAHKKYEVEYKQLVYKFRRAKKSDYIKTCPMKQKIGILTLQFCRPLYELMLKGKQEAIDEN